MKNLTQICAMMIFSVVALFVFGCFGVTEASAVSMAFVFAPVTWPCGGENIGGFLGKVLVIPDCMIKERPDLKKYDEITATADYSIASGAYTFKETSQRPIFVYATDDTVSMKAENQGEYDGQSFKITGEFKHPGASADVAAFARQINNTRCDIVLEARDGKQYLVKEARIKPASDFGMAASDKKGFTFTFEANSFAPFVELETPLDFDEYESPVTGE